MGAFYSSIQVHSENREAVKTALEAVALECGKKFLVGPVLNGWVGVYPDDSGDMESYEEAIASRLETVVLSLMVHDSDVFFYKFFRDGELLNEYSSDPDNFEQVPAAEHERLRPKPELFQTLVESPEQLAKMCKLLDRGDPAQHFTFEENRLEKFAALIGIRNTLTSYEYLTNGERDGIKGWKEFIHVPDQGGEKAAKKAAEAALRAEMKKLQKAGLLCFEGFPPGRKKQRIHIQCNFLFDPADSSLLVQWTHFFYLPPAPPWVRLQSPWISEEPVVEMPSPGSGVTMHVAEIGKWLAVSDGGIKIWDRLRNQLVVEIPQPGCPIEFSRDETLLLCRGRNQTFDVISIDSRSTVQTVHTSDPYAILHPSNRFLVTRTGDSCLGIFDLETGKRLKKLQDSQQVLNFRFNPDGQLLFCATTVGLHVLTWNELLAASDSTPKPLFSVIPSLTAELSEADDRYYVNFIYDVILDETRNRLLFCGIEGKIRFLNMNDGSAGILFNPPGKSYVSKLLLSPDRKFICCLCIPPVAERNKESPSLQVWNYSALCHAAGLG